MNRKLDKKKGLAGILTGGAISLVVLSIVIATGMLTLIAFNDEVEDTTISNVLNDSVVGISGFIDWYDIIVIMLVVAVIFSLLGIGIMAISTAGNGATI